MYRIALFVVVVGFILSGCSNSKTSDRNLTMISATEVPELVGTRKSLMGLGEEKQGVLIDARSPAAYADGHIPGAINVPYADVRSSVDELSGWDTLVVYGDTFNSAVAMGMAKTLGELGFKDVRCLRGGMTAWTAAGNEVAVGR